jgi:tetratricopeptide (TPR) repeat protein
MVHRLSELLSIINSIRLKSSKSQGWRTYYGARLAHLNGNLREAETQYTLIVRQRGYGDTKLHAYALCDLGGLLGNPGRVHETGGLKSAKEAADESLAIGDPKDAKLNENHVNLGRAYARTVHDEEAIECYKCALTAARAAGDRLAEVVIWSHIRGVNVYTGDWPAMLAADREARPLFPSGSEESSAMRDHLSGWAIGWAWAGRYKEAEDRIREARRIQRAAELGGGEFAGGGRDLGFVMAMQDRYSEATKQLEQTIDRDGKRLGKRAEAVALGFLGAALLRKGELDDAEKRLGEALSIKRKIGATQDIPEVLVWLGQLAETRGNRKPRETTCQKRALEFYEEARLLRQRTSRQYFQCLALVGIVRTKYRFQGTVAVGELPEIKEAEALATQFEYNDCMAVLRLTQGDVEWADSCDGGSFTKVERLFREALIFAMRFNRFALDEVLDGRGERGTFLHPISEQCREHGKEGARMLDQLSDWWQKGKNEIEGEKLPTVSPIKHGISLLDAEKDARTREPGNGTLQPTVLAKLESLRIQGSG